MENWDLHLPLVIHQMNSADHSVTKYSPFQIETGFRGENINDKYRPPQEKTMIDFKEIEECIQSNHDKRKSDNEDIHQFQVGDLVLCKNTDPLEKILKWTGPLRITKVKKQGLSFILENPRSGKELSRHISNLKPYHQRSPSDNENPREELPATPSAEAPKRTRAPYFIQTRSQTVNNQSTLNRQESRATNDGNDESDDDRQTDDRNLRNQRDTTGDETDDQRRADDVENRVEQETPTDAANETVFFPVSLRLASNKTTYQQIAGRQK